MAPEQDDLNMTGMRVAVNVDERFLHDAKQCEARPLVERRCIEIAFKNCPNTGSAFESADQSLKGLAEAAFAEFGRIMEERERPQFLIDVLDRV